MNHMAIEECGSGVFLLGKSVSAIGRHWINFQRRLSQKVNSRQRWGLPRGDPHRGVPRILRSRPVALHIKISVYRSCIY